MFKHWDRQKERSLVLVSGWAFDERIFEPADLPFNVISYAKSSMADFENDLLDHLEQAELKRVSLLGWSQGAFAAGHFSAQHPERVEELVLISLRPAYDAETIQQTKSLLHRNKRGYLRQFYKSCFSGLDLETYRWFKQTLQPAYLEMFSKHALCQGLDWLSQARLRVEDLKAVDSLTVIHGRGDRIAPVQDVEQWVTALPRARFLLWEQGGHVPFLLNEFSQCWNGY